MKTPRLILLLYLLAYLCTVAAAPPLQGSVTDMAVFYTFGAQITFQARIESSEAIQTVYLVLQPAGDPPHLFQIPFSPQGEILFERNVAELGLRPFAQIDYSYQIITVSGAEFRSPTAQFRYDDNRVEWQTLQNGTFIVHWQNGDLEFGQKLLNASMAGLQKAQTFLSIEPIRPLRLFVYPSAAELKSALNMPQEFWAAGHASPDLGVLLVSIPPSASASYEMERQIPHEITHILLYQQTNVDYANLPTWLNEGLASQAELYPNPDYRRALSRATTEHNLLPLTSLCQSFPRDASNAFLAYAQSASFTEFLYQKFGSSGINHLIIQYQDGKDCQTGVQAAFGTSLSQLQTQWEREALGSDPIALLWLRIRPFVILGLLILVPSLIMNLSRK